MKRGCVENYGERKERERRQRLSETQRFLNRKRWHQGTFWNPPREPRSDILSTWPALEEHCKLWGPPWTPIDLGFRESR